MSSVKIAPPTEPGQPMQQLINGNRSPDYASMIKSVLQKNHHVLVSDYMAGVIDVADEDFSDTDSDTDASSTDSDSDDDDNEDDSSDDDSESSEDSDEESDSDDDDNDDDDNDEEAADGSPGAVEDEVDLDTKMPALPISPAKEPPIKEIVTTTEAETVALHQQSEGKKEALQREDIVKAEVKTLEAEPMETVASLKSDADNEIDSKPAAIAVSRPAAVEVSEPPAPVTSKPAATESSKPEPASPPDDNASAKKPPAIIKAPVRKELPPGFSYDCSPIVNVWRMLGGADDFFIATLDVESYFVVHTPEQIAGYDTKIVTALRRNDVAEIRRLHVEEGRPLQVSNKFGETICHMACRRGVIELVKYMVEEGGVSLRVRDDYGRTPMHDSCWTATPQIELMYYIINHAPEMLFMTDVYGFSPLGYARFEHWAEWNKFIFDNYDLIVVKGKQGRLLSEI